MCFTRNLHILNKREVSDQVDLDIKDEFVCPFISVLV